LSTTASTQLNRILRTTANLLFEKGEDAPAVINLLQGFVAPSMVRKWHQRYQEVHGLAGADTSKRDLRRLPMPPIAFQSVELKTMEQLLEQPPAEDDAVEPDW
jgi:hypothetical protein